MRLKLLVLLFVSLMLPTLVLAEIMTVSFSGTEMRSAPNAMSSKVIVKLAPCTPLQILEKEAEYYKVNDYRGRTGWVHRSLLGATPGVVITGDRANVRKGPGVNHSVIFKLSKGEACRLLSKEEKWLEIQAADGRKGWVAEFLTWGQQIQ
jgi:SH3-like domain-containing protein